MSRNWGSAIADALVQTAGLLERLPDEGWQTPSLCQGWSVRDVAGHMVWRIGSNTSQMLMTGSRAYFGKHLNPMRAMDDLSLQTARAHPDTLVRQLRHIAALKLAGSGRTNTGELSEALVHSWDIAQPLHTALQIDPGVSYAVAAQRMRLPMGRSLRAIATRHSFEATDAGWRVGEGPAITGTAQGIILFLFGRTPVADERASAAAEKPAAAADDSSR